MIEEISIIDFRNFPKNKSQQISKTLFCVYNYHLTSYYILFCLSNTPESAVSNLFQVQLMIQKRRRCLFFCPSWEHRLSHCLTHTGQTTLISPRQYGLYRIRYIDTYHVDVSLSSACCGISELARFVFHNDRRSKTSFSYIRPPAAHEWAVKRWCKDRKKK